MPVINHHSGTAKFHWPPSIYLSIYTLAAPIAVVHCQSAERARTQCTLNTTHTRLDLIQRLAKIRIRDKALARNLTLLVERFGELTNVRNELNHCMFIYDASGAITHTQSMRLVETKANLRFGEMKALDEKRLKEMLRTTNEMPRHLGSAAAP